MEKRQAYTNDFAYIVDADTYNVHRVPIVKFERLETEREAKIKNGVPSDTASNEMHAELIAYPVVLTVEWIERVL